MAIKKEENLIKENKEKKEDSFNSVQEVKKSKIKQERIPTGIKGLNALIEGGFERNSINTIVGNAGGGKTIFSMQILMAALKRGENCLFISFEEKKDTFFKNMEKFGWDLNIYEKKGKFFFLEYNPQKLRSMIEEGGGEIEGIVLKNKIQNIVIDSITSFELLFEDKYQKREAALSLFDLIRKWNCTIFLTLEEDPKERDETSPLEFESDGVILIYLIRKNSSRGRYIEIFKMRGTKHSTKVHRMELTQNGFEITNEVLKKLD